MCVELSNDCEVKSCESEVSSMSWVLSRAINTERFSRSFEEKAAESVGKIVRTYLSLNVLSADMVNVLSAALLAT